jgi:hypothetical protein
MVRYFAEQRHYFVARVWIAQRKVYRRYAHSIFNGLVLKAGIKKVPECLRVVDQPCVMVTRKFVHARP